MYTVVLYKTDGSGAYEAFKCSTEAQAKTKAAEKMRPYLGLCYATIWDKNAPGFAQLISRVSRNGRVEWKRRGGFK